MWFTSRMSPEIVTGGFAAPQTRPGRPDQREDGLEYSKSGDGTRETTVCV